MQPIRRVLALTSLLLLVLPAHANTQNRALPDKTFMWKVDRGETTLYLLGSVHALKQDAYPLPPVIDGAFEKVDVVVFEIDLAEMTNAAIRLISAGSLEEGRTLEQVIGARLWSEFEVHVSEAGIDPSFFQGMKPWMAAITLAAFELTEHGYLSTTGLDTHLSKLADEAGKTKMALETAEYQVGLFDELTPAESLAFLEYTLKDLETIIPEMDQLYLEWRRGNVGPVEEMLLEGLKEFPAVFERIVTDRNRTWMSAIEELLAGDQDAMVVVGAMHLVGEGGIVNLLRQEGYSVIQQ